VGKAISVSVLNIILVVLLFLSGIATCILILMHSGKGTGVSELIASSMYNASAGSGIWEKNLDRLTVITSLVFIACVLIMALTFPLGMI
jgi:preprotein translocase subunit SecG